MELSNQRLDKDSSVLCELVSICCEYKINKVCTWPTLDVFSVYSMHGYNEQDNRFYFIIIIMIMIMIMITIIIIITIVIAVISERDGWERGWLRRNSVGTWGLRNVFCLDIESVYYSHKFWVAIASYANILCTTLYWKIIRINVFLIW